MTPHEFDRQLAEQMGRFYADPRGFVLFTFPWGVKGTALEKFPLGPDEWALRLFEALAKHIMANMDLADLDQQLKVWRSAVASGHGIGKSAFVAWLILFFMSTRIDCRGFVTANTGDQLSGKTWPELAKWHQLAINRHWFTWTATSFYYAKYPEDKRKNYMFEAVTWSTERSEGFAGAHNAGSTIVFIEDEASAIPDKISEVISGALTDGEGFWFKFGNPTRNEGRFFDCFNRDRKYWYNDNIDSRDVRIPNKQYLQELVDTYGEDSDYWRVRVRGMFPRAGVMQFIPEAMVDDAFNRALPPADVGAPLLMGVDVAVGGGDKCVMRFRRGLDARSLPAVKLAVDRDRGQDSITVANKVAELIDRFEPDAVFVDEIGVGFGVADILKQMGYGRVLIRINQGSTADNPVKFRDKKAEMWDSMKQWLKEGGCLEYDKELRTDLSAPMYDYTMKQALFIESKKDMKRRGKDSPDDAEALSLTFGQKVARLDRRHAKRRRQANDYGIDYDVFTVV